MPRYRRYLSEEEQRRAADEEAVMDLCIKGGFLVGFVCWMKAGMELFRSGSALTWFIAGAVLCVVLWCLPLIITKPITDASERWYQRRKAKLEESQSAARAEEAERVAAERAEQQRQLEAQFVQFQEPRDVPPVASSDTEGGPQAEEAPETDPQAAFAGQKVERVFRPAISPAERERLYADWTSAVKRSMDWVRH